MLDDEGISTARPGLSRAFSYPVRSLASHIMNQFGIVLAERGQWRLWSFGIIVPLILPHHDACSSYASFLLVHEKLITHQLLS